MIWINPGARMTTNRAGKMKRIVGKRILVPAFWAISSACCRRLSRSVSAWMRRDLIRLAPRRSAWMMTEARLRISSRSVRSASFRSDSPGRQAELDLALDDVQLVRHERVSRPQVFGHVA